MQDQQVLCCYYEDKIRAICKVLQFPYRVQVSAAVGGGLAVLVEDDNSKHVLGNSYDLLETILPGAIHARPSSQGYIVRCPRGCRSFTPPLALSPRCLTFIPPLHPARTLDSVTCVFLATKTENHYISLESFCKRIPKLEAETILESEFVVADALRFHLAVHHPYLALHGIFLDAQVPYRTGCVML